MKKRNMLIICAQVGANERRPSCKGGGELKKEEGEEEGEGENVLRVSHNLFNTTLRPLVAGLEYHGAMVNT